MIESAYETLKVGRDASPEEVRKSYVRLVRRYPPEHFPEKFAQLRNAYAMLTLDDDAVGRMRTQILAVNTAETFAGFLWGDLPDFKNNHDLDFERLYSVMKNEETAASLRQIVDEAAQNDEMEWRK